MLAGDVSLHRIDKSTRAGHTNNPVFLAKRTVVCCSNPASTFRFYDVLAVDARFFKSRERHGVNNRNV